jgi:glutathione peroxidase-family protein
VAIIVNVASKCGLTATNYKELAELHDKYAESKGLRILAFPCNQFNGQVRPAEASAVCISQYIHDKSKVKSKAIPVTGYGGL